MKKIKIFLPLIFIIIAIFIAITKPFINDLDGIGHYTLMMIIITISLWIFKPFNLPMSVVSGLFLASLLIMGLAPNIVFSGFSGGSVWTLIPALFYGYALSKTGLGKRIAFFFMKSIKITYPTLLFTWTIIGVFLSMLTPSITVRVIIVMPIALNCVEACGIPKYSKGRSLVLITAWAMAVIPGTAWLTGSLAGPMLTGFYASVPELPSVTFPIWLKVSLLPILLITIITVILGYFVLKPKEKLKVGKELFGNKYRELGNISFDEKITLLTLVVSFIFFTTSSIHKIPDSAICLIGLFVLALFKVIEGSEISTGISWDLVIFIGTTMGFGTVFSETGISSWLSKIIIDLIAPITTNPWIFICIILIVFFLIRFIDIAGFVPTMAIMSSIAPELFKAYGINYFIWIPLLCIAMNSFLLSYTNMFALVAESNLKDNGWVPKHLSIYGTVYFIAAMMAMVIAIPYWDKLGLIFVK